MSTGNRSAANVLAEKGHRRLYGLRGARTRRGWTRLDVARRAGVSLRVVVQLEEGALVDPGLVEQLVARLGVSRRELERAVW